MRLFFCLLALCSWTAYGSVVYEPEETPVLRQHAPLSLEACARFEKARQDLQKNEFAGKTFEATQIPLFKLKRPGSTTPFFVLGTEHSLPYEALSPQFDGFLQTIDTLYVESEVPFLLYTPAGATRANLPKEVMGRVTRLLNPLVEAAGRQMSSLTLEELYNAIMLYDCLIGMDKTIMMRAHALKKPLFLLDAKIQLTQSNLNVHRAQLADDDCSDSEAEENRQLIQQPNDFLMRSFIETESSYYIERLSQGVDSLAREMCKDVLWWREEGAHVLSGRQPVEEEPGQQFYEVESRNKRWIALLMPCVASPGKKLVCVGVGHLPDLFKTLKENGFSVEPYAL